MNMNIRYILDENGDPIPCEDLMTWARWFEENREKRRVAYDKIGTVVVSTVFLALDYQFGEGEPILYETMVFGGPNDQDTYRAYTKEEALGHHAAAVLAVKTAVSHGDTH